MLPIANKFYTLHKWNKQNYLLLTLWTCSYDYIWKQRFSSQTGDVKFSNTKVTVYDAQLSHDCIAWWHIVQFQSSPPFLTLLRINSLRNLSLSLLHFYHPARFTKNLSMCNFSDKDENVMSSCYVDILFVWHFFIFLSSFIHHMFWCRSPLYSKLWI